MAYYKTPIAKLPQITNNNEYQLCKQYTVAAMLLDGGALHSARTVSQSILATFQIEVNWHDVSTVLDTLERDERYVRCDHIDAEGMTIYRLTREIVWVDNK